MHKPPAESGFSLPNLGRCGSAGEEQPRGDGSGLGPKPLCRDAPRRAGPGRHGAAGRASGSRSPEPTRAARFLPSRYRGFQPAPACLSGGLAPTLTISWSPGSLTFHFWISRCLRVTRPTASRGRRAVGTGSGTLSGQRPRQIPEAGLSSPDACLIGQSPPLLL